MVGWKNADVERNMDLEWAAWYVIVSSDEMWKILNGKFYFDIVFPDMSFHMYLWLHYDVLLSI
jgi:hypothetical protein